jgi:hypothetical protein
MKSKRPSSPVLRATPPVGGSDRMATRDRFVSATLNPFFKRAVYSRFTANQQKSLQYIKA